MEIWSTLPVSVKGLAKGATVAWTSSDKTIATVTKDKTGQAAKLYVKKVGKAKITAKVTVDKKVTATYTLTVTVKDSTAKAAVTPTAAPTAKPTAAPTPTAPPSTDNSSLSSTVWSKYPDQMDWWYGKMDGIEDIISRSRSYANSWIFNPDGTFVLTMRWLTGYGTAYQMGGVLVTRGKYQLISNTQFKLTDLSTNRTTGPYYGTVTGWFSEKGEINCEYEFFTDSDGEGIKIKMDGVGILVKDSPLGEYDNNWSNYWKRDY
jgi:hypothetical protein